MPLPRVIEDNKIFIIAGGLVVGVMSIFNYLPATSDILSLGERVKYVYFGYIVFCAWLLFRTQSGKMLPRTVISRDLSNPAYRRNLGQQYSQAGRGGIRYPNAPIRRDVPPSVNEQFRRER